MLPASPGGLALKLGRPLRDFHDALELTRLTHGQVGFFGIGAYASSLAALGFKLTTPFEVTVSPNPVWLSMLAGMVAAGLAGWFIGRIAFKVRGAYFVIVSISFAEVMRLVAVNWLELTQGPMALNNIPPLELFGHAFWRNPIASR